MECLHCRRIFISEASFRNKEIHFCKFLEPSTLTTPSLLDKGELDSKGELSCILCGQLRDSMPIFASKEDLKKHILFGHTAAFVILKDLKAGSSKRPKVTSFPAPCVYCSKADASTVKLIDWEQAVLHVGIDHGKLFYALKRTNDVVLMKEFYPAKFEADRRRKASNKLKKKSNQVEELIPDREAAAESFFQTKLSGVAQWWERQPFKGGQRGSREER